MITREELYHGKQGRNWGWALGRAPPPAFHTLAKDRSLREAQHILHFDLGHVLSQLPALLRNYDRRTNTNGRTDQVIRKFHFQLKDFNTLVSALVGSVTSINECIGSVTFQDPVCPSVGRS